MPTPVMPLPPASSVTPAGRPSAVIRAARRPLDGMPTGVTGREPRLTVQARGSRAGDGACPAALGPRPGARLTPGWGVPASIEHMKSPNRGFRPPPAYSSAESGKMRDFACSSPSDTVNPHERPFTGMLDCHPRSASGRGGCSFPRFPWAVLLSLVRRGRTPVASLPMVTDGASPARRVRSPGS